MTTLFNLDGYNSSPTPIHDPYWDEIVLDSSSPQIDQNGQTSLFYDDSQDPPDPDDFPSLDDYNAAWEEWKDKCPDLVSLARICTHQYKSVGEQVENESKNLSQGSSLESENGEQAVNDTAHQHIQFVEKYCVKRSGKNHYYYRYTSMTGRAMNRTYIGAVKSTKATAIVEKVRQAIACQESPEEIQKLIRSSKITTG